MRHQLELFLTALAFFTRLPVPAWLPWSPERLNHAARYFPWVGWIVGGACAGLLWLLLLALPFSRPKWYSRPLLLLHRRTRRCIR